jgi:hypothetical protein
MSRIKWDDPLCMCGRARSHAQLNDWFLSRSPICREMEKYKSHVPLPRCESGKTTKTISEKDKTNNHQTRVVAFYLLSPRCVRILKPHGLRLDVPFSLLVLALTLFLFVCLSCAVGDSHKHTQRTTTTTLTEGKHHEREKERDSVHTPADK